MALGVGNDLGQGFLTDYSNTAGIGAAFQGFAGAYKDAQDQQMKRQELQSKIMAQQQQMTREATETALKTRVAGLQQGPGGPTDLQPAPLDPKQMTENSLKAATGGAVDSGLKDTAGNPIYQSDPNYWRRTNADNLQANKDRTYGLAKDRFELAGRRFEETQGQNAIAAGKNLNEDPVLRDMQDAHYSLSRGRSLLQGNAPLTMNNMNAVGMDIINGMTKGGQSSEGKVNRELQNSWKGHYTDIMNRAGNYGPDTDIRKVDPGLYKEYSDLLEEVDGAIGKNSNDRLSKLKAGYGASKNPKMKSTIDAVGAQYAQPPESAPAPGLVKPGLVKQGAGLVGGGQPPAIDATTAAKIKRLEELKAKAAQ